MSDTPKVPPPPPREDVDEISRDQGMISDEWAPEDNPAPKEELPEAPPPAK